jgi:hypothetical protein
MTINSSVTKRYINCQRLQAQARDEGRKEDEEGLLRELDQLWWAATPAEQAEMERLVTAPARAGASSAADPAPSPIPPAPRHQSATPA